VEERQRCSYCSWNWLRRVPWLTPPGVNGNKHSLAGRCYLIVTGKPGKDFGRMGVIAWQTKMMVLIVLYGKMR
jgi:hypothetical protein